MIDRENFNRIKERFGHYASWAVWGLPTGPPKSNMENLRVLDPDRNPGLLQVLRNDVVMLGLNISGPLPEPAPFRNFHYGGVCHDYKTRYAFMDTPYWGAYMTDFIKDVPVKDSNALIRYLSANPSLVRRNVERLLAEFNDLKCDRPIILAFGNAAYDLFVKHFPRPRYSRPICLPHYSDYRLSKEVFRERVHRALGLSAPEPAHTGTVRRGSSDAAYGRRIPVIAQDKAAAEEHERRLEQQRRERAALERARNALATSGD
jgi:hypothetical protein